MKNPWNLNDAEIESLRGAIQHGKAKPIAKDMKITQARVGHTHAFARKKMGNVSLIKAAVLWDRYDRHGEMP